MQTGFPGVAASSYDSLYYYRSLLTGSEWRSYDSINYESLTQRKYKCRFVIVVPDIEFDAVRMHCMVKLL